MNSQRPNSRKEIGMKTAKRVSLIPILSLIITVILACSVFGQSDQASLLLDLKKARAAYEISKQKLENDRKLFENKAISEDEFNRSKNETLSREVDYQKLILRVMAQQSYIIVEKAVKYQSRSGERRSRYL